MTPADTVRHLQAEGFHGAARVRDGETVVFIHANGIVIQIGEHERLVSVGQFEAEFSGKRFRKVRSTEI